MKPIDCKMTIIMVFFVVISGNLAFAQFIGPRTTDKTYTVREIKENASKLDKSDVLVKVQGYIVRQLNKDTYELKDSTGIIKVEIDKDKLPAAPFDENTELILIGEVDNDLLEPVEIEVKKMQFVSQR